MPAKRGLPAHNCIITSEANRLAAEIATLVTEDPETFKCLKAPPKRICALQVPIPYSPVLEDHVFPERNKIKEGIRTVLEAG